MPCYKMPYKVEVKEKLLSSISYFIYEGEFTNWNLNQQKVRSKVPCYKMMPRTYDAKNINSLLNNTSLVPNLQMKATISPAIPTQEVVRKPYWQSIITKAPRSAMQIVSILQHYQIEYLIQMVLWVATNLVNYFCGLSNI